MSVTPHQDQSTTGTHHLSPEEVRFFDDNGYLVLRDRIPDRMLTRLQEAAERMIATGKAASDDDPSRADYEFAKRPHGRVMFRVNYLHSKGEPATLELLGCPEILGIAETLAGPNFVPTYESLVFKERGDGVAIQWHQDAVHPRNHRIFNVDVYLDPSLAGEGALRVAPGTHRTRVDVCDLEGRYGWNAPGVVQVELEPGDVLVHDVMVVHGSEAVTGNRLRRTIYYEFRPAEQILAEGPWDAEWIDKRLRLVPVALAAHQHTYPDRTQFGWNAAGAHRPVPRGDDEVELRIVHEIHTSGSYCSAGDVPGEINRPSVVGPAVTAEVPVRD